MTVSVKAIHLRHLLGLHQQGVPVMGEWVKVLRQSIAEKDVSLLTVFALEPGLLKDPTVQGAFRGDIQILAEEILKMRSKMLRSEAMLFGYCIRWRKNSWNPANPLLRRALMTLILQAVGSRAAPPALDFLRYWT